MRGRERQRQRQRQTESDRDILREREVEGNIGRNSRGWMKKERYSEKKRDSRKVDRGEEGENKRE